MPECTIDVLSPGLVRTPGLLGLVSEDQQEHFVKTFGAVLPTGRLGDPDDAAAALKRTGRHRPWPEVPPGDRVSGGEPVALDPASRGERSGFGAY